MTNKITDPTFGLVQFNRVNHGGGKSKLFGSAIDTHHTSIMLKISHARVHTDTGHPDLYMDDSQIIEVELSNMQFSELLTTMNSGPGTPCTIRWQKDIGYLPDPPAMMKENDRVKEDFDSRLIEKVKAFSRYTTQILAKLENKEPIKAADRKELKEKIQQIKIELECNAPFFLREFEESVDKMQVAAKAEVDAMITHVMQQLGVKTFKEQSQEAKVKLLTTGEVNGTDRSTTESGRAAGDSREDSKEISQEAGEVLPPVPGSGR